MKSKRIFISLVLAAVFSVCSFTSCAQPQDDKDLSETSDFENYFSSSEIPMPEGMVYAQNIAYRNNSIYLSGITSVNQPKRYLYGFDMNDGTFSEINTDQLSDKYITAVYMDENGIITGSRNGSISLDGKDIFSLSPGKSARSFYKNQNDELIIISADNSNNFWANICSSTAYEMKDEYNFTEICNLEFGTGILNVHFKDGLFYLISEKYEDNKRINDIYVISDEKTVVSKFENVLPDTEGYYENSYINKRGNICVMFRSLSDSSLVSIDEIDISDGTRINTYEDKFEQVSLLTFPHSTETYDFMYWDGGKIYGYDADNVKRQELINRSDEENYLSDCYCAAFYGNRIILYSIDTQSQDTPVMYSINKEGKQKNAVMSSDYTETGRAESIIVLSDGRMCISECTRGKYVLRIIDENGKTVSSVSPCSENDEVLTGIACAGQDGEIYFVQKADTEKGKMIKVSVFDESGNIRRETDITDNAENIFVKGVFGSEGSDFLIYELNTSESIESFASEIDYGNGTLKKGIMEGICGICENAEGNLWFYTNDGVYDYDKDTDSSEELINWSESDIISQVYSVCYKSEDSFICITNDKTGYHLLQLDRADESVIENLKNRTVIRLAGINIQLGDISSEIEKFNSTNEKYRIQVTDYLKYSSRDDYDESIKKLNLDIVSGKVPDILIGNASLDLKLYSSKNMFADLNPYIEKDETVSRSDYLENILDCFTEDGKQVMFPLRFRIFSPVGKADTVGEKQGWTYDEFFKLAESRDIFYKPSQEYLSEILIYSNITEFVDYREKKCDFESGLFKRIIEYISETGIPYDEKEAASSENSDDEEFRKYCRRFTDNLCCATNLNTSHVREISKIQNGDMNGEKIAYKGVPASSGNGVLAVPYPMVAVTEHSQNKDGAWEFVRQLISDDYQNKDFSFPVKKSAFEKYINQPNQRTSFAERPDGTMYETEPLSDEDIEKFSQAVQKIDHIYTTDSTINGIINEQLSLYLTGQQSSSETVSAVQNKVSRYLSEIK